MSFRPVGRGLPGVVARWIDNAELREAVVEEAWRVSAGEAPARHTVAIALVDGVLRVALDDPKWRASLQELRGPLLEKLRVAMGRDAIRAVELFDDALPQSDSPSR